MTIKKLEQTSMSRSPTKFMDAMVRAGVDAVILFPLAGPVTEYEWIIAAQERDLGVIVGGEMTHPRFLEGDFSSGKNKYYDEIFRSLGMANKSGFIRKHAPEWMYEMAARMGVTSFVVPGNKPERIMRYRSLIERCGVNEPTFFAPGFVEQGGKISEGAKAAGERFHAIVGRGITGADYIRKAVEELTSQL